MFSRLQLSFWLTTWTLNVCLLIVSCTWIKNVQLKRIEFHCYNFACWSINTSEQIHETHHRECALMNESTNKLNKEHLLFCAHGVQGSVEKKMKCCSSNVRISFLWRTLYFIFQCHPKEKNSSYMIIGTIIRFCDIDINRVLVRITSSTIEFRIWQTNVLKTTAVLESLTFTILFA